MENFDPKFEKLGKKGEEKAVKILKEMGFVLSRPDYRGYRKTNNLFYGEKIEVDEEVEFEIKAKTEPFKPPPFYGHGADIYQINKRMKRFNKNNIKQFLIIFEKSGKIYGQWLHILEKGKYFDTKKGKRIYPLESFHDLTIFYERI